MADHVWGREHVRDERVFGVVDDAWRASSLPSLAEELDEGSWAALGDPDQQEAAVTEEGVAAPRPVGGQERPSPWQELAVSRLEPPPAPLEPVAGQSTARAEGLADVDAEDYIQDENTVEGLSYLQRMHGRDGM